MVIRTLKKGAGLIHITDKSENTSSVFGENFTLFDNISNNTITISIDLNKNYKGSKGVNSLLDIQRLDKDLSIITQVEIDNDQVLSGLKDRLKNREKKPEKFMLTVIAKNQITKEIQLVSNDGLGLIMRVID